MSTPTVAPDELAYALRPLQDGDLNFCRKSWTASYVGWLIPQRDMRARSSLRQRLARGIDTLLLTRSTWVACDKDDENHIFGFACGEKDVPVLHYVFVKPIYRRIGLARSLMAATCGPAPLIACTHWGYGLPQRALQVGTARLVYVGTVEPPAERVRWEPDHAPQA